MALTFVDDETSKNVLRQADRVRLLHHVPNKCDKILKESFTYAGATPELKPNFLKRLTCAFTRKKKSLGDDSNKQNGDQKQEFKVEASETNEGESVPSMSEEESNGKEINVEASETNEGESVPSMSEEESNSTEINAEASETNEGESVPSMSEEGSNGKKIEKASKNCTNGAEKDNKKSNDGKDVKAEEKPSVGVDKNGTKAAPERTSVIERCKNNKDVRYEDPRPTFQRLGTKYITSCIETESSYTEYEKPGEAQKARAAEVQTKSEPLVKSDIATLEPVSGEVTKEHWSKQVQGGQGRLHDKAQRGGKYNGNGKGR